MKAEAEGAIPWNDSEGHDSPHDLAWFLRDKTEVTEDLDSKVDYVTSVARMGNGGAAFLVKFQTGKRLRVTVTEEPSVRFYPAEGEPDERERKEFREAFEGEEAFRTTIGAPPSREDMERIKGYKNIPRRKL